MHSLTTTLSSQWYILLLDMPSSLAYHRYDRSISIEPVSRRRAQSCQCLPTTCIGTATLSIVIGHTYSMFTFYVQYILYILVFHRLFITEILLSQSAQYVSNANLNTTVCRYFPSWALNTRDLIRIYDIELAPESSRAPVQLDWNERREASYNLEGVLIRHFRSSSNETWPFGPDSSLRMPTARTCTPLLMIRARQGPETLLWLEEFSRLRIWIWMCSVLVRLTYLEAWVHST